MLLIFGLLLILILLCLCLADFPAVRQLIKQKPYCGVMIGVQKVTKTSSIQVYGVDKLTSDHLTLYFESTGVSVADVTFHTEHAVVDFTDSTGQNAVHVLCYTPQTHISLAATCQLNLNRLS